jgi:hypothetical protein
VFDSNANRLLAETRIDACHVSTLDCPGRTTLNARFALSTIRRGV